MLDKKVKYAITSLAFNHNGNLLALSSYSNDEIEVCKIENNLIKTEKKIKLTAGNNPANSLVWSANFLVCIDAYAKQISKINYETGTIEEVFTHSHARVFESIDLMNIDDQQYYLIGSRKIHPPTIEKMEIDVSYEKLKNIFIINEDLKIFRSCSIPGNVLQVKFDEDHQKVFVVSTYLDGTSLFVLDTSLNIEYKIILTSRRAISAFIALSNKVSVLCQVNQKDFKSVFSNINYSFSEVESYIKFEDLKFTEKNNEYINSIFGYKKILVAEFFNRDIGESFLSFIDTELNEKLKNIQVDGFMESMALNEKFIAWSENNKIRVIESK